MSSYLREVAFELRKRGTSEVQIAAKIAEMSAVTDPEREYGTPREVAEAVPSGNHRSLGHWVVRGGVAVMVAAIAWFLWVQVVEGRPVGFLSLVLPTVVLVLAVSVGAWLDHRLPQSDQRVAGS